jgi:hypothetical protein
MGTFVFIMGREERPLGDEWVSVTRAFLDELYLEIVELRAARTGLQAANVELFEILMGLGVLPRHTDDGR